MSILEQASAPKHKPIIATIVGGPGTGKTSLAATFPKPIILRTQGEDIPRDCPGAPLSIQIENSDVLWETLKALLREEHDYQTVVIDSVTGLEQMFIANILEKDKNARGINQALGGYGAGPNAVSAMHGRVRNSAEYLRARRGVNVLFLAHADIMRIDPPDSDGYSQYTLRLSNKSIAHYVDSVDLVGHLKQRTILRGEDDAKKAITTGERVLTTYLTPASVSKNRLGITDDIEVEHGVNPLAEFLSKPEKEPRKVQKKQAEEKEIAT